MKDTAIIKISGIGWVLPWDVGGGGPIPVPAEWPDVPDAPGALEGFNARPYLGSVKGYLDPAGHYTLAAASLALGEWKQRLAGTGVRDDAGVCAVTFYGAQTSAYRFFEMFAAKGPRFASPMMFPHGYPNTAGNLVAIEFGFGGPHMVYDADANPAPAMHFALRRLVRGDAQHMLVCVFEATHPPAIPDGLRVLNGAIALWLSSGADTPELAVLDDPDFLRGSSALRATGGGDGAVIAMLRLAASLGMQREAL